MKWKTHGTYSYIKHNLGDENNKVMTAANLSSIHISVQFSICIFIPLQFIYNLKLINSSFIPL